MGEIIDVSTENRVSLGRALLKLKQIISRIPVRLNPPKAQRRRLEHIITFFDRPEEAVLCCMSIKIKNPYAGKSFKVKSVWQTNHHQIKLRPTVPISIEWSTLVLPIL